MDTNTTANAGAPAGATDGKAGSSTANTPAPTEGLSSSKRMLGDLQARRKAEDGKRSPPAADDSTNGKQPPVDEASKAGKDALPEGDTANGDAAAEKGKKDQEKETIPLKAFKERLGQVNDKLRSRTEERDAATMRAARAEAAVKLLAEEFEAFKAAARSGRLPDERDEQLRQHDLEKRAAAERSRIEAAHTEAQKKTADEERTKAIRERVDAAIAEACGTHKLVRPALLRDELRRVWQTNPRATPLSVAAALEENLLNEAKQRLVPPEKPAPTTVQTTANGSSVRFEDNPKGMLERLRARRAASA